MQTPLNHLIQSSPRGNNHAIFDVVKASISASVVANCYLPQFRTAGIRRKFPAASAHVTRLAAIGQRDYMQGTNASIENPGPLWVSRY